MLIQRERTSTQPTTAARTVPVREPVPVAEPVTVARPITAPRPLDVAGLRVVPFESYDHALACIESTIESGDRAFWVAVNPQKCFRAWHESKLLNILNRADVAICDGVGMSLAARILHGRTITRCTGCDLFFRLMPLAATRGWRVFLLGASPESNSLACSRLRQKYPGLQIVGSQDGFFEDSSIVIDRINSSKADMLFVAMGSPKQEYWLWQHRREINAAFCMGVGGSLDVASGVLQRAPSIFRKTGTEFLFQLITEPRTRWKRQKVYFPFMLRIIGRKLSGSVESGQWGVRQAEP